MSTDQYNKILQIARAAHNVMSAYCRSSGDSSIKEWEEAPQWQREDTLAMVRSTLKGVHSPEEEHGRWFKNKVDKGYVYGPEKNDDASKGPLTNPNMIPYRDLPLYSRMKDILMITVVVGLAEQYGLDVNKVPVLSFI